MAKVKTTTTYSVTFGTNVPLTYRCEHCGKDVAYLIPVDATVSQAYNGRANFAQQEHFSQVLSNDGGSSLDRSVKDLENRVNNEYRYDFAFPVSVCPHCSKEQTWKKFWNSGLNALIIALSLVAMLALTGLLSLFVTWKVNDFVSTLVFVVGFIVSCFALVFVEIKLTDRSKKKTKEYSKGVDAAILPHVHANLRSLPCQIKQMTPAERKKYFRKINSL